MIQSTGLNTITGSNNHKKKSTQTTPQTTNMISTEITTNNSLGFKTKDTFIKSSKNRNLQQITYSKPKTDHTNDVNALLEQNSKQIDEFKDKILSMISEQNENFNNKILCLDLTLSNNEVEYAKQYISADGEWGIDAVATRIMDMAYSLSGGDTSKIELLRNAVIDGFKEAGFNPKNREKSNMPEITGQTYDEVMKRFDDWKNRTNINTGSEE